MASQGQVRTGTVWAGMVIMAGGASSGRQSVAWSGSEWQAWQSMGCKVPQGQADCGEAGVVRRGRFRRGPVRCGLAGEVGPSMASKGTLR